MRLLVIVISSLFFYLSCSNDHNTNQRLSSDYLQMGTKWQIQIEVQDTVAGRDIINSAWRLLDTLNTLLTNYNSESEISKLGAASGSGEWMSIHAYTTDILLKSKKIFDTSNGAFDITIGPASKLWRRSFKRQEWPSEQLLDSAISKVGMTYLEINPSRYQARLTKQGMSLDLGGIGKGYAVDKIVELLLDHGYDKYLVEGGGDLRVGSPPIGQRGWVIERESLDGRGILETIMDTLSNVAIATSGNAYQYIDRDDHRYQHHINPFSGQAANDVYLVVVESDLCWKSDAISTAISILGADKLNMTDYQGYMITGNGSYKMQTF